MKVLAVLLGAFIAFSLVDQIQYGFNYPLYIVLPITLVVGVLAYGFWHLRKWSVYLYTVLAIALLIKEWIDFQIIELDFQLFVILLISFLLYVNRTNLE
ncbi:hypothetical protein [Ekhidna sp.]|uniref:hypothetical protein n=1 Tax=Ekhidna sp. TaxID=2608089 RepID=UPI0032996FEC